MSERKWQVGPVKLVEGGDATIYQYCEKRRRYIGAWSASCGCCVYAAEWDVDGSHWSGNETYPALNLAPPPKKTMRFRRFICLYPDGSWSSHITESAAVNHSPQSSFAIFEIDREVTEGEGISETPN